MYYTSIYFNYFSDTHFVQVPQDKDLHLNVWRYYHYIYYISRNSSWFSL